MRRPSSVIIVAIGAALSSCNPQWPSSPVSTQIPMTNAPGVIMAGGGRNELILNFAIRTPGPLEPKLMVHTASGGGCIVGEYPVGGTACTADSQCSIPEGPAPSAYCLPRDANGNGSKTCWAKPSDDYCLKPVGYGVHQHRVQIGQFAGRYGVDRWRAITCLNGVQGACATPGSPRAQHRAGPIYP